MSYDGTKTPLSGISVSLHDDTLDLGDDAVIARGHDSGGHLSDGERDSLALRGHDGDMLADLDAVLVAENARQEDLRAVAHGIHGRVLEDDALVRDEKRLQWLDHAAQVRLVFVVVVGVLRVQYVVHRHLIIESLKIRVLIFNAYDFINQ